MAFGEIIISVNGEKIPASGDVTFTNLNGFEKTFESNMDGSIRDVYEPRVAQAEIENLSACAYPIEGLINIMRRCPENDDGTSGINVIIAMGNGCDINYQVINFVNARIGGSLSLSASTGQVSGFVIASDNVIVNGQPLGAAA